MTFEKEMNRFFETYSAERRAKAEADPEYQKSAQQQDAVKAMEIAQKLLEGEVCDRRALKLNRKYK